MGAVRRVAARAWKALPILDGSVLRAGSRVGKRVLLSFELCYKLKNSFLNL
jgi:hypothetical protein